MRIACLHYPSPWTKVPPTARFERTTELVLPNLGQWGVCQQHALVADIAEPDRGLRVVAVATYLDDDPLAPTLVQDGVALDEGRRLTPRDRRNRGRLPSPFDGDLAASPRESDDRVSAALPAVALLRSAVPRT